jgi:hypothetical protein
MQDQPPPLPPENSPALDGSPRPTVTGPQFVQPQAGTQAVQPTPGFTTPPPTASVPVSPQSMPVYGMPPTEMIVGHVSSAAPKKVLNKALLIIPLIVIIAAGGGLAWKLTAKKENANHEATVTARANGAQSSETASGSTSASAADSKGTAAKSPATSKGSTPGAAASTGQKAGTTTSNGTVSMVDMMKDYIANWKTNETKSIAYLDLDKLKQDPSCMNSCTDDDIIIPERDYFTDPDYVVDSVEKGDDANTVLVYIRLASDPSSQKDAYEYDLEPSGTSWKIMGKALLINQ